MKQKFFWFGALLTMASTVFAQDRSPSPTPADFDVIIKGGTVYDGTGAEPKQADVAIRGDRIAGIGDFKAAKAKTMINAKGLAVAPGFINMTGEITLRGLVLPIGGLKEKSLAAMRAGISTVIIPKLNEKDLVDVPEEAKQKLKFVPVENVDEVLAVALEKNGATQQQAGGSASPKTIAE